MSASPWRLIRDLISPQRKALALFGGVLAIATLVPLGTSVLLSRIVRDAVARTSSSHLVTLAAIYAGLGLIAPLLTLLVTWRANVAAWAITNDLRHQLADYVLSADLSFHRDRTPGELVTRVDADVTAMTRFLATVVAQVIAIVVLAFGTLVACAFVAPRLLPGVAACHLLVGVTTWSVRNRSVEETVAERAAEADVMSVAEQYLAGADDVASLGAGLHAVARFGERAEGHVEAARQRVKQMMFMQGSIRSANGVAQVFIIGLGALLARRGNGVDVGTVVLGYRLVDVVGSKIDHLQWRLQEAQGASGAARRVMELLGEHRIVATGGNELAGRSHDVAFEGVSLVYDDGDGVSAAIDNLTLPIPAGRVLGIVGRTGSGKTSLIRLLLRLVSPTSGSVRVGNTDISTLTDDALRSHVVAVPQDVQLFPGSVADNVALFADTPRADIDAALRTAGLGAWLDSLPDGLGTRLSSDQRDDGGTRVGLSAGQAQLLALSRALSRNPSVVVLDEATSRVDPVTQAALTDAMAALLRGRTGIIVAHRLETLDRCDDIAVLEQGQLVEHGARETLAADPTSRYARLRLIGSESEELR